MGSSRDPPGRDHSWRWRSFLLLYAPILARLAQDWANDDNYSHGFLIVPLALYFVWERRQRLAEPPIRARACSVCRSWRSVW